MDNKHTQKGTNTRREFLEAFHPDLKGHLEIAWKSDSGQLNRGQTYQDIQEALVKIQEKNGSRDIYFSPIARKKSGTDRNGQTDDSCLDSYAVWADVDDHDTKWDELTSEEVDAVKARMLKQFDELPVKPSIIVFSGRGYQLFWLFDSPISPKLAEQLNKRVASYLKQMGINADSSVKNPARVMRMVFTKNHSSGLWSEPLDFNRTRYEVQNVEEAFPEKVKPNREYTSPKSHSVNSGDAMFKVSCAGTVQLILEFFPQVGTLHNYSLALAGFLLGRGIPSEALEDIFEQVWQHHHPEGTHDAVNSVRATARKVEENETLPEEEQHQIAGGRVVRGILEDQGLDAGAFLDALTAIWALCGVGEPNVKNPNNEAQTKKGRRMDVISASDIKQKEIQWYWKGWLAKGKLSLWDGDPGVGKSLATTSIAATLTNGGTLPGGTEVEPMNVLLCNLEDGSDDTIVPRLVSAGANLNRVFIFNEAYDKDDNPMLLQFPRDVDLLEAKIIEHNISVVFLDPIATMVDGDLLKDQDAKKCLTPIANVADRTGVAIVGVRHYTKGLSTKAINKGGGSLGVIGVARLGANFEYHPDDWEQPDSERRIVMALSKTNISGHIPSLVFRKVTTGIMLDKVKVEWLGTCDLDANALARASANVGKEENPMLDAATSFIRDLLEDGPVSANEAKEAIENEGITKHYRDKAKANLKVKSIKASDHQWYWVLPLDEQLFDKDNPTVLKEVTVEESGW